MPVPQMPTRWTRFTGGPDGGTAIAEGAPRVLPFGARGDDRDVLLGALRHVEVLVGDQPELGAALADLVHDVDHVLVDEIVVGLEEHDLLAPPLHQLLDPVLEPVETAGDLLPVEEDLRRAAGTLDADDQLLGRILRDALFLLWRNGDVER